MALRGLIALLCVACGANQYGNLEKLLPLERVADRNTCLDISYCRAFMPFYRLGSDPPAGQVFWLISNMGHACVTDVMTWTSMPDNAMVPCNWRFQR